MGYMRYRRISWVWKFALRLWFVQLLRRLNYNAFAFVEHETEGLSIGDLG